MVSRAVAPMNTSGSGSIFSSILEFPARPRIRSSSFVRQLISVLPNEQSHLAGMTPRLATSQRQFLLRVLWAGHTTDSRCVPDMEAAWLSIRYRPSGSRTRGWALASVAPLVHPLWSEEGHGGFRFCKVPAGYWLRRRLTRSTSLSCRRAPGIRDCEGTGLASPTISTMNAPAGNVVANAAILYAGTNGAISFFASDTTNLLIDIKPSD
jgi:hypothetical protein